MAVSWLGTTLAESLGTESVVSPELVLELLLQEYKRMIKNRATMAVTPALNMPVIRFSFLIIKCLFWLIGDVFGGIDINNCANIYLHLTGMFFPTRIIYGTSY